MTHSELAQSKHLAHAAAIPNVSAVTVTYNSMDVLEDFLASVLRQEGTWTLYIVDNQSTDGTRDRLAAITDSRIRVILNEHNTGFAAGTNIGVKAALACGADAIILLNNDTEFGPELFSRLAASLKQSRAAAVSPVIVYHHNPSLIWYAGGKLVWRRGVRNVHEMSDGPVDQVPREVFQTAFCPACCMMFDRSVFERIGGLDEDYFCYWEDADLCYRMGEAGMRIIVDPTLILYHKASTLTGGTASDFFVRNYERNRILFMRKARGQLSGIAGAAAVSSNILARLALGREDLSMSRRRLGGVLAGLKAPISPQSRNLRS